MVITAEHDKAVEFLTAMRNGEASLEGGGAILSYGWNRSFNGKVACTLLALLLYRETPGPLQA